MGRIVKALGAVSVAVVFIQPFLVWVRAHVLLAFVGWFIDPLWPAFPSVSVTAAMGIVLLPQVVASAQRRDDDEDRSPWLRLANAALTSLATSGLLWISGRIIVALGRLL